MKKTPYSAAAEQARLYEQAKQFVLAAISWNRAASVARLRVNQEWAAVRADVCEKILSLNARLEQLQESASERAKEAAKTKAKKKMVEALKAHIKTTGKEESR
ncbi:ANR family transcriptional regulator [Serratia marcescens]|uniref:ANR family transcriptional regulator n=1 Tax=Serratia marcescens TaxID=615 RepID=UPI003D183D18